MEWMERDEKHWAGLDARPVRGAARGTETPPLPTGGQTLGDLELQGIQSNPRGLPNLPAKRCGSCGQALCTERHR